MIADLTVIHKQNEIYMRRQTANNMKMSSETPFHKKAVPTMASQLFQVKITTCWRWLCWRRNTTATNGRHDLIPSWDEIVVNARRAELKAQNPKRGRPDLGWTKVYSLLIGWMLTPVITTISFRNSHNIPHFLRKYTKSCTIDYYTPWQMYNAWLGTPALLAIWSKQYTEWFN
jgi:hypothetical protein